MKLKITILILLFSIFCSAHFTPNSILMFDVHPENIDCELQIPLKELQLAVNFDISGNEDAKILTHKMELENYIKNHFRIEGKDGKTWEMIFNEISISDAKQTPAGIYKVLITKITILPTNSADTRNFKIYYNAVIQQVVTHKALVNIRDWENGNVETASEIGNIGTDTETGKILPFEVNLKKGNNWKGFVSMVKLGMQHISEGTDHLMFLLVLLLTAPLLVFQKKWIHNPDQKKSFLKILKITIAFTIGHSITLVVATLGFVKFPVKPVEIMIAISILITAIHAIKPIFPNRENYIAGIFGLVHGLAFSTILSNLHLHSLRLGLSLLGFNLGIEIMQIFVVFMAIPWLLYLSKFRIYAFLRIFLAGFAILASLSWIFERYTDKANFFTKPLGFIANNLILFVVFLFLISVFTFISQLILKKK